MMAGWPFALGIYVQFGATPRASHCGLEMRLPIVIWIRGDCPCLASEPMPDDRSSVRVSQPDQRCASLFGESSDLRERRKEEK